MVLNTKSINVAFTNYYKAKMIIFAAKSIRNEYRTEL